MQKLSSILQFVGFFGMVIGLGTTCTVLWYSVAVYFVGFVLFLIVRWHDSA